MAGIIIQWYDPLPLPFVLFVFFGFFIATLLIGFLPISIRFQWRLIQGLLLNGLLISLGLFITRMNDPKNDQRWYGNHYREGDILMVRLAEPLTEKASTYKTEAIVESIWHQGRLQKTSGKILLYFFKDSLSMRLRPGDRLAINKPLQAISNPGNPGAFDYRQYAALHQWYHRAYVRQKEWKFIGNGNIGRFNQFITTAREKILDVLRRHLPADKEVLGIAEALLIGYTNDLDKDLVQAYSNTGVVHIIAISGMHLALIYLLLVGLFKWMPGINRSKLAQVILILACLWFFSLLTGASPSVLRAAVMFSFISIGKNFIRPSSVYNSLAASAFVLLCWNPAYLWDVGFQLSYLAVAGILLFQRPLYQAVYLKFKWADKIWQLASVTLAAQVFTFPVCLYYFHQFPVLFLLANLFIVPLSGLILYAELILLAVSWIPYAGQFAGMVNTWLIRLMNGFIRWVNQLPYAVWDEIPAGLYSTVLLYGVVGGFAFWLLGRKKTPLFLALISLFCFTVLQAVNEWRFVHQRKLVVYQVPKYQAIDIINGHEYRFIGDSSLLADGMLSNFNLKPSRTLFQLKYRQDSLAGLAKRNYIYHYHQIRFAVIEHDIRYIETGKKFDIDFIIISRNPGISLARLNVIFNCRLYILDASNSLWKIDKWLKEAEALHLRCHSIPEKGAFITDL
ncbi:MAG: ComEC/Rec2 family competence protein [Chitinophagaceae bacterium]|nr:ComEC/Rec2 family competence protein [Chitinophagaceae bacterium]